MNGRWNANLDGITLFIHSLRPEDQALDTLEMVLKYDYLLSHLPLQSSDQIHDLHDEYQVKLSQEFTRVTT